MEGMLLQMKTGPGHPEDTTGGHRPLVKSIVGASEEHSAFPSLAARGLINPQAV